MYESEIRINVIETFDNLQKLLSKLKEAICINDVKLPGWFQLPDKMHLISKSYREQAGHFISQLEFLDSQEPKEILVGPGVFACSEATYHLINEVNKAKDNFKQAMLALKEHKIKVSDPVLLEKFENLLKNRSKDLNSTLRKIGLARLHLKQCYRKISVLESKPKKISWTWANTRSIKKIDLKIAKEMLSKLKQDQGVQHQLAKLQTLDQNEKLAIIQELAPHMRSNILMDDDKRFMIKGSMPIFYLEENHLSQLPEYVIPKIKSNKNLERQIRSDVKIDPEPFLPAIRAHRYLSKEFVS